MAILKTTYCYKVVICIFTFICKMSINIIPYIGIRILVLQIDLYREWFLSKESKVKKPMLVLLSKVKHTFSTCSQWKRRTKSYSMPLKHEWKIYDICENWIAE